MWGHIGMCRDHLGWLWYVGWLSDDYEIVNVVIILDHWQSVWNDWTVMKWRDILRHFETSWKKHGHWWKWCTKIANIGVVKKHTHFVKHGWLTQLHIEHPAPQGLLARVAFESLRQLKNMQPPAHRTCHIKISSMGKPSTNGYQWDIVHFHLE